MFAPCKCVHHVYAWCPQRTGAGVGSPADRVRDWLWTAVWVLGTEPMSSERVTGALRLWTIFPVPINCSWSWCFTHNRKSLIQLLEVHQGSGLPVFLEFIFFFSSSFSFLSCSCFWDRALFYNPNCLKVPKAEIIGMGHSACFRIDDSNFSSVIEFY